MSSTWMQHAVSFGFSLSNNNHCAWMCIRSTYSHSLWSGSEGMLSLHCSSWTQGICHSSIYRLQRKCWHHSRLGLSLEPELWLEAQLHSQWYWIHVIAATICLDACIYDESYTWCTMQVLCGLGWWNMVTWIPRPSWTFPSCSPVPKILCFIRRDHVLLQYAKELLLLQKVLQHPVSSDWC